VDRTQLPRMPLAERDRRWADLRRRMADQQLDVLLVCGNSGMVDARMANVHYLSLIGGNTEEAWLVFPRAGEPTAYIWSGGTLLDEWRDRGVWIADLRVCPGSVWSRSLATHVQELGLAAARIGVVGLAGLQDAEGVIPYLTYQRLQELLPRAELVNATAVLEEMRLVKSADELAFIEAAAAIADAACLVLQREAVPGASEYRVFAQTMAALLEHGSEQPVFFLWDAGPAVNHARRLPARRTLADGDVILTEICPRYFGYWANYQYPVAVGGPTDEYRELYAIALAAFENAFPLLRPGVSVAEVGEAVAAPIREAGCTSLHALAQGTGHCPAEVPVLRAPRRLAAEATPETRAAQDRLGSIILQPGMILALQPHVTRDLKRGVRLGDPAVITPDGARRLSALPLDAWGVRGGA
jgi:Xaa-Pro dipeptidase